jgi:T5SS/PEP-CTERM-associated repeat protein
MSNQHGPASNWPYLGIAGVLGLTAFCFALIGGSPAVAAVSSSGNVVPVPPPAGGAFAGPFEIGDVDVGTMNINTSGGASPISHTGAATLGDTVTGVGIANLSGLGSDWTLTSGGADMMVANNGTGSLNLSNLAFVSIPDDLFVAAQLNSLGEISISGLGTILTVGDDANIGQRGQAAIDISNGGRLITDQNIIGDEATGDGRVTLSDQFSLWRATSSIIVADAGRALLQIFDGARVENSLGIVASQAGSTGTVEVVGLGSLWQSSLNTIVGESGVGTLRVSEGGRFVNNGSLIIGRQFGAVGEVEVRGLDSQLTTFQTDVGDSGDGTLRILEGGHATSSGQTVLGDNANSRGVVLVDGDGSRWEISGALDVGDFGEAQLTIANSGVVRTSSVARVAALGRITLDGGRLEIAGLPVGLQNSGVIDGNGTIEVPTANNGGRIRPQGPEVLLFTGTLNNSGLIDVQSGILEVAGPTISNNDIHARDGAVLRFRGTGLDNNAGGQLAITSGNVDVFGLITNDFGAEIAVGGSAVAVFHDAVTNNGTLFVQPGGRILMLENLGFAPTAILSLPLAASGPGQVDVVGTAQLAGNLDITLTGGFVPQPGDQFTLLHSGGLGGTTFDSVTGGAASGLQFFPTYTPTDVRIFTTALGERTWGVDARGQTSVDSNWFGGVAPSGVNESIAFTTVITADRTIQVDAPISLAKLRFDGDDNYTLAGPAPIRMQAAGPAAATITVENTHGNGTHTINTPIEILGDLVITQDSTQPLTIGGPLDAAGRTIIKEGAGTVIASRVRTGTLSVNEGSLIIAHNGGTTGTSVADSLSVNGTSRLDVNNNDLVVHATAATTNAVHAAVQAEIVSAQNDVDVNFVTNWNGPGITSSTARSTNVAAGFDLTALGVIRNSDLEITTGVPGSTYTTFSGQTVTPDDVLVKYTYTGDGNLDGAVTFDDYAAMDSAFFGLIPNLGWATGDINFDGVINFDDYSVVDQAFFFQGTPLSHAESAAVPEPPAAILVLSFSLAFIVTRCRSQLRTNRTSASPWGS